MKLRNHLASAFVLALALRLSAGGQQSHIPPSPFRFDDPMSVMRITEYEELQRAVSEIDKASEFRRILLLTTLKETLGDESRIILKGYSSATNTGDLTTVAGRARWLIEHILQQGTESTNGNVDARLELWKATAGQRRAATEETVRVLREKYRGNIHAGIVGEKAVASVDAMDRFLDEWFPYGKRVADMEEITGLNFGREGAEAVLRIDSGYGGYEYRLHLTNGVIEWMTKKGLD